MVKKFQVTGRVMLNSAWIAFNIFNHPVYAFSQNNGQPPVSIARREQWSYQPNLENGSNDAAVTVRRPLSTSSRPRCSFMEGVIDPSYFFWPCAVWTLSDFALVGGFDGHILMKNSSAGLT